MTTGFFPPDPPFDEPPQSESPPWRRPPEDELPVFVPVAERLAVTERLAVLLVGVRVYSGGVEFRVERRFRREGMTWQEWQVAQQGFHGPHGGPDPGRLRYGIAFADGETVVMGVPGGGAGLDDPPRRWLTQTDGSGSGSDRFHRSEDGLWLWPLPPEGPLEFVVEWPAHGIPESRVVLDGTRLRELAAEVTRVWE